MTRTTARCNDCRVDTLRAGEWYMVHDPVWVAAGMATYGGFLCVGCLERHLGRFLDAGDFTAAPVNRLSWGLKSTRLRDRLMVAPGQCRLFAVAP